MLDIFTPKSIETSLKEDIDSLYFNSIEDVQKTKEYIHNEMQIYKIKSSLKEDAKISEDLIDLLIDAVEEKVSLEYDFANMQTLNYITKMNNINEK